MLSDKARRALFDIRENGALALKFAGKMSVEQFGNDKLTFYGVTRALEIVSEAVRRLPQSLRDRHPDMPWRAIMGVGNIYRHDYDNVAEEFVWRTVRISLPQLLTVIEAEIALLSPD